MKARNAFGASVFCTLLAMASWLFLGCELDSTNSVTRETGISVEGVYYPPSGSTLLVSENSGKDISMFNLRQSGDQLEAVDNNGSVWRGTLGRESESLATFVLTGQTTAGQGATADGTIEVSGNSRTMRGSWTEASVYGTIYGQATGAAQPTNEPSNQVDLVADDTSISVGGSVGLTASGASSYDWSSSGTASGTFAEGNGTDGNNSWKATTSGTVTLTASDHSNGSDSDSVDVTVTP